MNNLYSIINGDFVPPRKACLLVSDLAVQRGYGIFDFFRTIDYKPRFLEDHLDRFYHSASGLRLDPGLTREELKDLLSRLIRKNKLGDSGLRLTLTGGYAADSFTPATPNLIITQHPFQFDTGAFARGIRLMSFPHQRQLPGIKSIDYLQAIYLQPEIRQKNADDVLYHSDGVITECPRANFFIVNSLGELITPGRNVLAGITRKAIMGLGDFPVREDQVSLSDLPGAKEAFITSTTRQVQPVLAIDGKPIGEGSPGPITGQVYAKLLALH